MREIVYYTYRGETQAYYYWELETEHDELSRLYIARWRVPEPLPLTVYVTYLIDELQIDEEILQESRTNPGHLLAERIVTTLDAVSYHTTTVRYDVRSHDRQLRSVYVPNSILGSASPKTVQMIVDWA